jgi:hypothetical protein
MVIEFLKKAMKFIVGRSHGRRSIEPLRCGSLRPTEPASRVFGLDRGQPIDRYYIEQFLSQHRTDVQGHVLEIGGREYTDKFGGGRTTISDVLHATTGNPEATLVGDLTTGAGIPESTYDCMLLTQTFPVIYDVRNAIGHARDGLKPGGVALITLPGISQISRYDMDRWGDYWRFTDASARRLFSDVFGVKNVAVTTYGNVLAAAAFLHGLAADEVKREELDVNDPDYQVTICVRAVR